MKTRIYLVQNGDSKRLVRAANAPQARSHVVKDSIVVAVASQDDLVQLAGSTKVEEAASDE